MSPAKKKHKIIPIYIGTAVRIEQTAKLLADSEMRVLGPTKWIHTAPWDNAIGHPDFCIR